MTGVSGFGRARVSVAAARGAAPALLATPGMTARALKVLLVALVSVMPLACGETKGASPSDGSSSPDGATCKGEPLGCVVGGPSGTGIACQGFETPATCVGGQWTCPQGMVGARECTCGEPGLSCSPQVCTEHGPVCLDAGVDGGADADAGHDAPVDGESCGDTANPYCAQGARMGDLGICDDFGFPATCADGGWTCPAGAIETYLCTCSAPHPPGCGTCTKQGWVCVDGGADGGAEAGAHGDAPDLQ
jgi:hypothetical protein